MKKTASYLDGMKATVGGQVCDYVVILVWDEPLKHNNEKARLMPVVCLIEDEDDEG